MPAHGFRQARSVMPGKNPCVFWCHSHARVPLDLAGSRAGLDFSEAPSHAPAIGIEPVQCKQAMALQLYQLWPLFSPLGLPRSSHLEAQLKSNRRGIAAQMALPVAFALSR